MVHYHLIGIGGTGLSAIARVLHERGDIISGSDTILSPAADNLSKLGIKVFKGHDAKNIGGAEVILRSSAITDDNPEVTAAMAAGLPVMKRRDFLADLTQGKKVIAIAGTHGKTTTTAMIAWSLKTCGFDPSYVIGSDSKDLGENANWGEGDYFVIEADEYDNMFLGLKPQILVITNIEHDHPDCFPTEEGYRDAFLKLSAQIQPGGHLIISRDDPGAQFLSKEVGSNLNIIQYGRQIDADVQISGITFSSGITFKVIDKSKATKGEKTKNLKLQLPGEHNALNATAALIACSLAGADEECIFKALSSFTGTGRRFDIIGTASGITIIDDYGHHPTEIKATLAGARGMYPKARIWAVWQPHTYSRTKELFDQFTKAFDNCDSVIVTEIYRSREKEQDYSSESVVQKMPHQDKHFIEGLHETAEFLKQNLLPGDVLIVFSAGDANQITQELLIFFTQEGTHND